MGWPFLNIYTQFRRDDIFAPGATPPISERSHLVVAVRHSSDEQKSAYVTRRHNDENSQ